MGAISKRGAWGTATGSSFRSAAATIRWSSRCRSLRIAPAATVILRRVFRLPTPCRFERTAVSVERVENGPADGVEGSNSLAAEPDLLSEFIVESREHLASIENQALALEQN